MFDQESTALEVQPAAGVLANQYIEQSVSMVQQLATARIQSAYTMAVRKPRQIEVIRQDALLECRRPSFCSPDESKNGSSLAIYRVPRGSVKDAGGNWVSNNIQGPTIRFAEMLLRVWGHLSIDLSPLGEDEKAQIYQVSCTDYQTCNFLSEIVAVPKTVERKKTKATDLILSQRTNSYGDPVYIVAATDEELAMKRNALVAKARRNLILQSVPGWLIEECIEQVRETAAKRDAVDPQAAKRKLYDAFAAVGVTATQLNEYLGHTNALSPAEMEDLRGFFSGIREGFTTWTAIIAAKTEGGDDQNAAARLEELLVASGRTPAQSRKMRGQYAGRPADLIAWLEDEAKKKADTGTKPQEQEQEHEPQPQPAPAVATKPAAAPAAPAPAPEGDVW